MNKYGVVVATEENLATVEIYDNPNCTSCTKRANRAVCRACADYDEASKIRLVAVNEAMAEVGDGVRLNVSKMQKIFSNMLTFVFPIVCAVISYFCVSVFTDADYIKAGSATAAGLVAMIVAGLYSYKVSKNICEYKIISVIKD